MRTVAKLLGPEVLWHFLDVPNDGVPHPQVVLVHLPPCPTPVLVQAAHPALCETFVWCADVS